jgi:hypothetical protein
MQKENFYLWLKLSIKLKDCKNYLPILGNHEIRMILEIFEFIVL